jgi:CheY-like chemotaxis protein
MSRVGYILLADDSEHDRELTRRSLKRSMLANEIIEVEDGAEVLQFLHRRGKFSSRPKDNPIFLLLDIKMPKLNGMEVLAAIRQDPELSYIPVIMLTSSRQEQDLEECYRLKANAYVVKPVDFDQFSEVLAITGKFWAVVNESPSRASRTDASTT